MEIVSIEKKTFDEMMARMGAFVEKVAALQRKGDERRLARWLTGDEVCRQLRISPRTLMKLRDKDDLPGRPLTKYSPEKSYAE